MFVWKNISNLIYQFKMSTPVGKWKPDSNIIIYYYAE